MRRKSIIGVLVVIAAFVAAGAEAARHGLVGPQATERPLPIHFRLWLADQHAIPQFHRQCTNSRNRPRIGCIRIHSCMERSLSLGLYA